jgi:16S rRNA (cytosine967-C5)-methyltransferase
MLDELASRGVLSASGHELLQNSAMAGNYLRTVPGVHACDGFFAAVLTAS